MYDLYCANTSDSERYILGKDGPGKLFVVGLNPSTANQEKSDITAAKVEQVASRFHHGGFVMTNLYPLRSTDPKNLPAKADEQCIARNTKEILNIAKTESNPVFWAAWGVNILIRDYLIESLISLKSAVAKINGTWQCYGDVTRQGHPRHPSRLSYGWQFQHFDLDAYIDTLTRKSPPLR